MSYTPVIKDSGGYFPKLLEKIIILPSQITLI